MKSEIKYIHEPTDLQCGQAVLAMILGKEVKEINEFLQNDKETCLKEMKKVLDEYNIRYESQRKEALCRNDLPEYCILSLETPRCWHWSLYAKGVFYDPEHGVMDDFPESKRKYFWKIYL